jgi:SAM-dependent methyltransferase
MAFSEEWNEQYKQNAHLSIWPWNDVVSLTMRNCREEFSKKFKVLELGCGAGANIPFFASHDLEYYAIDGSEIIVKKLQEIYPKFKNQITVGDFTKTIPFDCEFDLIVDRAAVTCNSEFAIRSTMKLVKDKLKPGGKFVGIDWYSTENTEFYIGEQIDDKFTRIFRTKGEFINTGRVHFFDQDHLISFFDGFAMTSLTHKCNRTEIPETDGYNFCSWNIVAKKSDKHDAL